jgi:uncharacterized lipoprotein YajG
MKRVLLILLISTAILTSCAAQPSMNSISMTPQSAVTATLIPPTFAAQFIDQKSGGFSLALQP